MFEAATGARVVFETGWGEEIPRLLLSPRGQPPYDVMLVAPFTVYPLIRRGHFEKLDRRLIPNLQAFAPSALDNWVAAEDWGLTWPDACHTGVFRSGAAKVPADWRELLAGKPALYRSSYMSLYSIAAAHSPGRAHDALRDDFESVYAMARGVARRVSHWWVTSPDMAFQIASGRVDGGNIHSVDVFPLMAERRDIDVLITPDRAHFQAIWLLPRGGRHRTLAHELLNQFASEAFQAHYATAGFPTPVASVAAAQAARDPLWARLYPHSEETLAALRYYPYDAYVRHWADMTERWNKQILAA